MTLRKHQVEFSNVVDGIIAGSDARVITLSVTPGGGKSFIPVVAGRLIEKHKADALAWVVPRQALQDQGEREFIDPFSRQLFNHNLTIRSATNDVNPCRGTNGFVTTYQALGVDTGNVISREFLTKRYILILDEYHHVEEGGVWHKALLPLFAKAAYIVLMTGTLERGDGKPIAFTEYRGNRPYLDNTDNRVVIRYNRQDALEEKAILPISFHLSDGQFAWEDQAGERKAADSFSETKPEDRAAALYTALNTDFAVQLLRECLYHWRQSKRTNPGAKLLIVTADYKGAQSVTEMLQRAMCMKAEIATSHKSKEAAAAIKRFKSPDLDILVTIAMAYEGLSVPPVTHICCLTQIRSVPWIEQMVARAVRIDPAAGPYSSQRAHVFAPKDPKFMKIVKRIEREQIAVLKQKTASPGRIEAPIPGGDGEGGGCQEITPIGGDMTGTSEHFVGIDPQLDIFQPAVTGAQIETVKEKEIRIRQEISAHVNRFAFEHRYKPQKINSELKQKMGKPRELLDLANLEYLLRYVKQYYPIEYQSTLKDPPPGVSLGRAKRKRVSTKVVPWKGSREDRSMKLAMDREMEMMDRKQVFMMHSSF
ncbi:DEAD/DEAH box helicase family protein [Desulfobacula sp.]|uniref:DEAD/DEAH box helicase n=1 Tax=Desulfobacula sp. TaxID=2593537 RepID=UPI002605C5EC|nr:DEAD/DEAH box helicase family protein [Desulfobacula sp.]